MLARIMAVVVAAATFTIGGGTIAATAASATPSRTHVHHAMGLDVPAGPPTQISRAMSAALRAQAVTVPASVDLTAWAPPAGDQGQVSSCVSWAIDYTAMGWYLRHDGVTGFPLAPMFTYAQLVQGQNVGTTFSATFSIAEQQGVDAHSDYWQGDYDYTTQPTTDEIANAATWKVASHSYLPVNRTAISTALAAGKPLVLAIPVYENFFSVSSRASDYNTISGPFEGYHAIAALGYDSYGVKIENSWGQYWGRNGFARLSWAFVLRYASQVISVDGIAGEPSVSSVSPASGATAGGQVVTITGQNFPANASVSFAGATATNVSVDPSGTSITATTPAHALGTVHVSVQGSNGTSASLPTSTFAYVPAPSISTVSVRTGASAGGTSVRITGRALGTTVTFGATAVTGTLNPTATILTAVSPPSDAGVVSLTVTGPGGTTGAGTFTYVPAPSISSVSTTVATVVAGAAVTINGTNLAHATVTIGGRAARIVSTGAGGASLVVAFPAGVVADPGDVVVTTVGGSVTASWQWR